MGDVVSLVEKAEEAVSADEAAELAKRMMTGAGCSLLAGVSSLPVAARCWSGAAGRGAPQSCLVCVAGWGQGWPSARWWARLRWWPGHVHGCCRVCSGRDVANRDVKRPGWQPQMLVTAIQPSSHRLRRHLPVLPASCFSRFPAQHCFPPCSPVRLQ